MKKNFVGSKGGSGIAQWLISQMPQHSVYCEPFLGRGVIMRKKIAAEFNIGIEKDAETFRQFQAVGFSEIPPLCLVLGDALEILPQMTLGQDCLLYVDPPYLLETRSCKRRYYREEMFDVDQHAKLLALLTETKARVMISGYWSHLYSQILNHWRVSSKWTTNRRGKSVQEFCWMNFPNGLPLHDSRFIGETFTNRQRIKRKVARWQKKLSGLPMEERSAVVNGLLSMMDAK